MFLLSFRIMPRAKLVDTKPRGRMSAYAFFVQTCREEHKKKHPDENVVFSEFSRKCAERWKVSVPQFAGKISLSEGKW
ncbi:High mobility group protein DSP1 [Portunus trituberculatus]|uniref:High mobility group protein DSP1 n=1 Tax=Portunus trituberculatus TaxID=210409 RepID=A0A5B7JFW0_PORTR|nr:High mobility group protein DSP1 [Portunus trituberculatus]